MNRNGESPSGAKPVGAFESNDEAQTPTFERTEERQEEELTVDCYCERLED